MLRPLLFLALLLLALPQAEAKPFRRALVIGGGGISPGVALGMIEGAKAAGYEPDLIITTCGATLGAALYNSYPARGEALAFAKSDSFYRVLKKIVRLDSWTALGLKKKFESVNEHPELVPEVFQGNILRIPESLSGILPRESFPGKGTKFIVIAARAGFGPLDQGRNLNRQSLYKETFFTDPSTAQYLKGFHAPVREIFLESRVARDTETRTDIGMAQAARASISDPYYVNPARIGNAYYFGGAVDLYPVETATDLADEVLINFPSGLYTKYEDLAIQSTFGFPQSHRTILAAESTNVKWIDSSGTNELALDPELNAIFFVNKIPNTLEAFRAAIEKQYRFGFARGREAVLAQRHRKNVRSHLRFPVAGVR